MQNQAAVEALYSAALVEDYLDVVENLPNEVQRHLSGLRELDLQLHREFLRELDDLMAAYEKETTASGQRQVLARIQKGLIAAQDLGDEKLKVAQALADTIENRSRLLEHDAKNLDFADDEEEEEGHAAESRSGHNGGGERSKENTSSGSKATGGGAAAKGKRPAEGKGDSKTIKRRKKQQASEKASSRADDEEDDPPVSSQPKSTSKSRGGGGGGGASGNGGNNGGSGSSKKPSAKKKSASRKSNADHDDSDKDEFLSNMEIDPDEPTYCLCERVSYGDMIGCDNDLCPIEWFHFNCVQLNNKPKGKWFCPKCRGDKATVMKPKAIFLKELDKFNKEKEEKAARQHS